MTKMINLRYNKLTKKFSLEKKTTEIIDTNKEVRFIHQVVFDGEEPRCVVTRNKAGELEPIYVSSSVEKAYEKMSVVQSHPEIDPREIGVQLLDE
jgi:hypothetical protein